MEKPQTSIPDTDIFTKGFQCFLSEGPRILYSSRPLGLCCTQTHTDGLCLKLLPYSFTLKAVITAVKQ